MKYISIDIETTGLDPEKHQILEFAAVYDDLEQPKRLEHLPKFHRLICWDDYIISDYCLKLHEELLKELRDKNNPDIITIEQLAGQFRSWLTLMYAKFNFSNHNYNVAGKNFAGFDGLFLKKIPNFPKWHHRVIDVGSMYMQVDMNRLSSLEKITGVTGHRALDDAMAVVAAIRNKIARRCPYCWSENENTAY